MASDEDHPTNLKRIGSEAVSRDSKEVGGSGEDFLTMAMLTLRHIYQCLLVNVALLEESPQKRPTIVGLHSLDRLQIVGVGRLHISNNLWRLAT